MCLICTKYFLMTNPIATPTGLYKAGPVEWCSPNPPAICPVYARRAHVYSTMLRQKKNSKTGWKRLIPVFPEQDNYTAQAECTDNRYRSQTEMIAQLVLLPDHYQWQIFAEFRKYYSPRMYEKGLWKKVPSHGQSFFCSSYCSSFLPAALCHHREAQMLP